MNLLLTTLMTLGFTLAGANKDECAFPLFIKDNIVILNKDNLDALDKMAWITASFTCETRFNKCASVIKMVTNEDKSRTYKFQCQKGDKI